MPPPQTSKLTLADTTVLESKPNVRALLLANGWSDDDAATNMAAACTHLANLYGPNVHVEIDLEKTPAHYQIIVTAL